MNLIFPLTLLVILFLASGFFSSAETAIFSLSRIERRRFQERHPKIAKWVLAHLNAPRRTLSTILIGNMFVNTLAAALATLLASESFGVTGLGLAMIGFTLALILFGDIIPKVLAVRQNEAIATISAFPLQICVVLITPIRFLIRLISDWVVALIVHDKKIHGENFTEAELRTLVEVGEEEGVLEPQESYMIQKLFTLGERPVKEIMIPRIDVVGLDIEGDQSDHLELIRRRHYTYFPVYKENMDHVLGVVTAQDYVLNTKVLLAQLIQQPLFIPETKRIDEVLEMLKTKNQKFAVCIDEHGGTAGIVTQEDVLEEIFGEYYDEYEIVQNPIRRFGHQEYLVEAKVALSEFNEYFSSNLEADKTSTLGGYILEKLGEVPAKGKVLQVPGFDMTIRDVIRHRIHHVLVKPATPPEEINPTV